MTDRLTGADSLKPGRCVRCASLGIIVGGCDTHNLTDQGEVLCNWCKGGGGDLDEGVMSDDLPDLPDLDEPDKRPRIGPLTLFTLCASLSCIGVAIAFSIARDLECVLVGIVVVLGISLLCASRDGTPYDII